MKQSGLGAAALAYLGREAVRYMDMILPIRRGTADVICADEGGVLLRETVSGGYFVTAGTLDDVERLLGSIDAAPDLVAAHQDFAAAACERRFGLKRVMRCHQAVWMGGEPPQIELPRLHIAPLPVDMAEAVCAIYTYDIGLDYIEDRLRAGAIVGAYAGDALAGFMGMHKEGSMGMLEVMPEYRRAGVATQLIAHLCGEVIGQGLTPFSQFGLKNEASRRLHERLGFVISWDDVYWLEAVME